MRNFRLTLQYDGTRYNGWHTPGENGLSKNTGTVSAKLQSALERITGESVELYAGARTDPGVHALEQTVSFCTRSGIAPDQLRQELNRALPMDISIRSVVQAPPRFRADLNALSRTYCYRICTAAVYDPFTAAFTTHLCPPPALSPMRDGVTFLTGKHDFQNFCGRRKKKGTTKEIFNISITEESPDLICIELTADDFLYRMPALIIGTLLEIGRATRTPDTIRRIFEGTEKAGPPCEAKGLLLRSVQY